MDALKILRAHEDELRREFGVKRLGVFGSRATGKARPKSDVDVLVEFARDVDFFEFMRLEERLANLLGSKVDLVTRRALKPRIGKRILEEVVYL